MPKVSFLHRSSARIADTGTKEILPQGAVNIVVLQYHVVAGPTFSHQLNSHMGLHLLSVLPFVITRVAALKGRTT